MTISSAESFGSYSTSTESVNNKTSRIDTQLNKNRKTEYLLSANAVELLPFIGEDNGKMRLTTRVNSNLIIGDIVYFCAVSGDTNVNYTDLTYVLDNLIEVSGCTNWYYHPYVKGYKVIDINNNKNQFVINRNFDEKFRNKSIYNHYVTKIYVNNQEFLKGDIDCAVFKHVLLNEQTGSTADDITIYQAIILSGTTKMINISDKYDSFYRTINTKNDSSYSLYYSFNNNEYGYTYVKNQLISGSTIDNGYFTDCVLSACTINGGLFTDCIFTGGTINNGYFSGSSINNSVIWIYGIWDDGFFGLPSWNNGIWNSGSFINKYWYTGIFNNGTFSGSTWENGIFNNGNFIRSYWSGGTFNDGTFNGEWSGGTFNGGMFQNSTWYTGIFNNGDFLSSTWYNGIFNNGKVVGRSITSSVFVSLVPTFDTIFYSGTINNGDFTGCDLSGMTIYNGSINKSTWWCGTINGGYLSEIYWKNGTFNDGIFDNRLSGLTYYTTNALYKWENGTFNGGYLNNNYWENGTFNNGIVNNSIIRKVKWMNGVFNGIHMGPRYNSTITTSFIVNWSGGTWNNGSFGTPLEKIKNSTAKLYMNWLDGKFYNGSFFNSGTTVGGNYTAYGGWSGGTFYNGNFYGDFFDGDWVSGNFISPPANWYKNGTPPSGGKNKQWFPYNPPTNK